MLYDVRSDIVGAASSENAGGKKPQSGYIPQI